MATNPDSGHAPPPPAPDPSPMLGAAADALAASARLLPADSSGRGVLTWIAQDARAGGRALAGVDLLRAYPPEVLVPDAEPRGSRQTAVLSAVRDVAVFLPIAVTWFSLWTAFDDFENAPEGTTFLELWSSGFGGTAVLIVVLLIAAVIGTTLWLQRLEWAAGREASRAGLRQRVSGQLAVLTMELSKHAVLEAASVPARQLVGIARDITTSTAQLSRTMHASTDRLEKIFEPGPEGRFVSALDKWSHSAHELSEMGRSLTVPHQLVRDFARMREELREDEEATRRTLTRLLGELRSAAGSSQEANRVHATVADEVSETTRRIGEAMLLFVDTSQRLYSYMDALQHVLAVLETGRGPNGGAMSNSDGDTGYGGYDGYGGPGATGGPGTPGGSGGYGGPAQPGHRAAGGGTGNTNGTGNGQGTPRTFSEPRDPNAPGDPGAPGRPPAPPSPRRPGDDWYGEERT
ncbi:hypothetical protein ABZZ79_18205 [Streptomyces sp. NPDC006458]|uniref:hypothetical protein n=1 Tax=Streptomyces sp. NPDC006458 TaxID=3154302 RepID=UPI0033B483D6